MKTVCVDLDGVLAQYDGWHTDGWQKIGKPIEGAREFLLKLKDMGCHIIIWTTRCNTEVNKDHSLGWLLTEVHDWLARYKMPYDLVDHGPAKPIASAYVDDRAVECRPQKEGMAYEQALAGVRILIE